MSLHNLTLISFKSKSPLHPFHTKLAIGEVHTFRQILQDPLSERPLFIFKAVRRVYGAQGGGVGTPTVLTTNGSVWHSKRKAIAAAFSSKHVKRMNKLAVEMTDSWIHERLQTSSNNNAISEPFDVAEEIVNVVLSAICETGFEYKISSKEKEQLGLDLQSALTEFVTRESLNKWRAYTGLLLPERRRAIRASQRFNALMLKIMAQYRMLDKPTPGTIINAVMESDAFPTDDEKAAQLAEFLVGGHDTTAYSISWILLELAKNPLEQKALREELVNLSPEEWNTSEKLKMVIKEGMRLHPVVAAGSVRRTGRDIITQRNELIPKGSICFCPFFLLFRNPDIFPNPNKFIPTRWENPTRDMRDAFNPFSMGKQNCAGQALARVETQAIVARICSQFELRVEDEGDVDFFLTLKPVGARLRAIKV